MYKRKFVRICNGTIDLDVYQGNVNGFEISFNPDDRRFYVCDHNEYGDEETRATFAGDAKGWANAVFWAKNHQPKKPGEYRRKNTG